MGSIAMALIWTAIIILALWAVDKLLLWMEVSGWINYRRKFPNRRSIGSAFLEVQSLIEPGKKATVEEMRRIKHDKSFSGDLKNDDRVDEPLRVLRSPRLRSATPTRQRRDGRRPHPKYARERRRVARC